MLPSTSRELACTGAGFVYRERPERSLEPDEIRLLVAFAGICGSDLHAAQQLQRPGEGRTVVFGHEYSGIVLETGAAVRMATPGQRVVGKPRIPCLRCRYCREDRIWDCERLIRPSVGAWAETLVIPERFVVPVSDKVSLREAALVEPISCCLRAIDRAARPAGHTALVIGGGPIGLITAALARALGATDVLVSEPSPFRRELAQRLGFEAADPSSIDLEPVAAARTGGRGFDAVYEAVGSARTVETAIACAGRGSTIVILGVAPPLDAASVRPFDFFQKELTLVGAWANETTFTRALALLPKLQLAPLITNEISLDNGASAIELARSGDCGKVLIAPNGPDPEEKARRLLETLQPLLPPNEDADSGLGASGSWIDMLGSQQEANELSGRPAT